MIRRVLASVCLILTLSASTQADPVIVVGDIDLAANTPDQLVEIFVTGGDQVAGLNLNVQVADGGPELSAFGGTIDGPAITDIDVITGTIFEGNNTGATDPEFGFGDDFPQLELRTITTASGFVMAEGLLATLTIDTTGFFDGSFALNLSNTLNGPTDFAGVTADITDGSVVIPEPSSMGLALAATLLFGSVSVCRARRRKADLA